MHSVFKIVQVGNWNAIHALLQSSPDSIVDRIKSGLLGGHTDGSMKFNTVRCRNSAVDFAR